MPWRARLEILAGIVCAGFVVSGLSLCWHWTCQSDLFRINKVRVKGCDHLTEEEVLQMSGVSAQDKLLSLNLKSIAESIKAYPWVQAVEVKRRLPDKLIIAIKERTPIALLKADKTYLVDNKGKIIEEFPRGKPSSLPIISMTDQKNMENHQIQKALELLSMAGKGTRTLGVSNISRIHVAENGSLVLYTADKGVPFHFDAENLRSQFSKAEKILYQLYRSGMYNRIDGVELSYGPGRAWAGLK